MVGNGFWGSARALESDVHDSGAARSARDTQERAACAPCRALHEGLYMVSAGRVVDYAAVTFKT